MGLSQRDLADLKRAKVQLEEMSFAMRLADLAGSPIEWGLRKLPAIARGAIEKATRVALTKSLGAALSTLPERSSSGASNWLHRGAVVATGGAGGFFGMAALAVELPFSTTVMLRSIADHARAQGEDLSRPETRLACLTVFALGGRGEDDDAAETGYFAVRAALARSVAEAAAYVAERGLAEAASAKSAPALVRLVAAIAQRFGVTVSEKAIAQGIPLIGALGGAAINYVFIEHFQQVAEGHFTVRRLERAHGVAAVRKAWDAM